LEFSVAATEDIKTKDFREYNEKIVLKLFTANAIHVTIIWLTKNLIHSLPINTGHIMNHKIKTSKITVREPIIRKFHYDGCVEEEVLV
jgi:hypothetical protein